MRTTHRPRATVCSPELCRYHRDFKPLMAHTLSRALRNEAPIGGQTHSTRSDKVRQLLVPTDWHSPAVAGRWPWLARAAHHHHLRCHFCARRWHRTRRPRLTPSPCSRTGSDALVGILVGDKEEPSSKRGHGDACASAGGVWTATLASRPLREGRAPAVRVRCGRLGPVKRVLYRPRTCLGRRYTHQ